MEFIAQTVIKVWWKCPVLSRAQSLHINLSLLDANTLGGARVALAYPHYDRQVCDALVQKRAIEVGRLIGLGNGVREVAAIAALPQTATLADIIARARTECFAAHVAVDGDAGRSCAAMARAARAGTAGAWCTYGIREHVTIGHWWLSNHDAISFAWWSGVVDKCFWPAGL